MYPNQFFSGNLGLKNSMVMLVCSWKNHSYLGWSCLFLVIFHIERNRAALSHKAILIEKKILFRMSIVTAKKALEGMVKFILFSKKANFRRKFMVFQKIFFGQKNQHKKLHKMVASEIKFNAYSRNKHFSGNST